MGLLKETNGRSHTSRRDAERGGIIADTKKGTFEQQDLSNVRFAGKQTQDMRFRFFGEDDAILTRYIINP